MIQRTLFTLLLASLATFGPSATALPVPEPAATVVADTSDAALDAADAGLDTGFRTFDLAQDFTFDTVDWGSAAGFDFYDGVQEDAFDAIDGASASGFDQVGNAQTFTFDRADDASAVTFRSYSDVHAASFDAAAAAAGAGFDAYDGVHGSAFDAADAASNAAFEGVGSVLDGGWEAIEDLRHLAYPLVPDGGPIQLTTGSVSAAGNGAGRPGTPPDMDDPYLPEYYSECAGSDEYRVVAFPQQDYANVPVFVSACTKIGLPVLQSSGSLVPQAMDHTTCAKATRACFWFGVDPSLQEVRFDAHSKGGNAAYYLVRLLVGSVSIDYEVIPTDDLPALVTTVLGTGSGNVALAAVKQEWSFDKIHAFVNLHGETPDLFVIHVNVASQGYDVQFGKYWDGSRLAEPEAYAMGPFTIDIQTFPITEGIRVVANLKQEAGTNGNHVIFGAGSREERDTDYTVDLSRPPGRVTVELRVQTGAFTIDSIDADRAMELHFLADAIGGSRVRARDVSMMRGLVVRSDDSLSGPETDDVCDQDAARAFYNHGLWTNGLTQTCIDLASATPTTKISYFMDGAEIGVQGIEASSNLHLALGPGPGVSIRALNGESLTATVSDLVVGQLQIPTVVVQGLRSFSYVGGTDPGATWALDAGFDAASVLRVELSTPSFGLKGQWNALSTLHVETTNGRNPLIVRLTGDTGFSSTYFAVRVDVGNDHFDFNQGSMSVVKVFEFVTRDEADYCDLPGEIDCWPPLAVTLTLLPGGHLSIGGPVYKQVDGLPDFEGHLKLTFNRDGGPSGNYHGKQEYSFGNYPCPDDAEDAAPGENEHLDICGIKFIDWYPRN